MPNCGSQVILCDVPIRFDTYKGCSHLCEYCFVQRKSSVFNNIKRGETVASLINFIKGQRLGDVSWCDWDIPLHWGGMSDPFQTIERKLRYSLEALKVFAKTQYPFIVSTKNKMIAEEPYLSLIKQCNCVVQFSCTAPEYDEIEKGASTFEERVEAARKITAMGKRVNMRCQPYIPKYFESVKKSIEVFHKAGVHGCIFEGIKYIKKVPGTTRLQGDFVYPSGLYRKHFEVFKKMLHERGMKFYCGENRLRSMGDSLCCCGIEGMGWHENKANLNHYLYDRENFKFTEQMKNGDKSGACFKCLNQSAIGKKVYYTPYAKLMSMYTRDLGTISTLLPDEKVEQLKRKCKKGK
nr:MAG TPA: DNA repair photolyase [Caudoviricetes sp.]